jgi:penicillin-binding protein A
VIALDVKTGAVVAAYSNPTYDPNLLASHRTKIAEGARKLYLAAPGNPLLPRAWAERFPPGSTFKTVTAAIAIENNVDVDAVFPFVRAIVLPQTNRQLLTNFGGERCGGTMEASYIVSCNTTFAQVGFDLGNRFAAGMPNFGVQTAPPNSPGDGIDPPIAMSTGPRPGTFEQNQPAFMQDAIGQNQVAVTPMAMALVAEAVATGGTILNPHFVQCVKDPDDRVVKQIDTTEYQRAMDPTTAATMRQFMLGVVNNGTGTAAQIPGVQVAGKTGTAETGPQQRPHAWFIEFAPADNPRYAIAVIVEHGGANGGDDQATGGRVAAPIAKQVMQALLVAPTPTPECGNGQRSNSGNGG